MGSYFNARGDLLMKRILLISCYLILSVCCLLFIPSCSKEKPQQSLKNMAVPVTVGTVIKKSVPVKISAIGNVEAYSTVGIKSQVGGTLTHVHFKEGQDVKKGDLLFTIDPRPYEAALKQAEANLAKDNAQLENARLQAGRYEDLVKKGYVAQEQYDQIRTNSAALEAAVNADKAAVENAQLQLKYCYIYSPLTGRTGSLISYEGYPCYLPLSAQSLRHDYSEPGAAAVNSGHVCRHAPSWVQP